MDCRRSMLIAIGHLTRHFGRLPVADLADSDRQQAYVDARHGQGLAVATIARELSVLRAAIRAFAQCPPGAPAPRIHHLDVLEPRRR